MEMLNTKCCKLVRSNINQDRKWLYLVNQPTQSFVFPVTLSVGTLTIQLSLSFILDLVN